MAVAETVKPDAKQSQKVAEKAYRAFVFVAGQLPPVEGRISRIDLTRVLKALRTSLTPEEITSVYIREELL